MATVSLKSITKKFDNEQVLFDVNLDIEDKEFIVFVGPSGCGKTTLLRIIAGLEEATNGEIEIDGVEVSSAHPIERGVSMVFQSYALYPHLNVFENIAFPLRVAKMPKLEIEKIVAPNNLTSNLILPCVRRDLLKRNFGPPLHYKEQ